MKYLVMLSALFAFSAYANQGEENKPTQDQPAVMEQGQHVIKTKKATTEEEDANKKQEENKGSNQQQPNQ